MDIDLGLQQYDLPDINEIASSKNVLMSRSPGPQIPILCVL